MSYQGRAVKPLDIGSTIKQAFDIVMGEPLKYLGISFVSTIAPYIVGYLVLITMINIYAGPSVGNILGGAIIIFVFLFSIFFAQGLITFGAVATLRGNTFDVGAAINYTLGQMVPLFLMLLVAVAASVGFSLVYAIVAGVLGAILGSLGALISIIALLVVMAMAACILFVTIPVLFVERPGVLGSFARSAELTSGDRWRVFALILFLVVLSVLIQLIVMAFGGGIFALIVAVVLSCAVSAVTTALVAATYFNLRTARDGVSLESLSHVFD